MYVHVATAGQFLRAAVRHGNLHGILVVVIQRPLTKRQTDLFEIVDTAYPARTTTAPCEARQVERDQHAQGDNHEHELDERKTSAGHFQSNVHKVLKDSLNDLAAPMPRGFELDWAVSHW